MESIFWVPRVILGGLGRGPLRCLLAEYGPLDWARAGLEIGDCRFVPSLARDQRSINHVTIAETIFMGVRFYPFLCHFNSDVSHRQRWIPLSTLNPLQALC